MKQIINSNIYIQLLKYGTQSMHVVHRMFILNRTYLNKIALQLLHLCIWCLPYTLHLINHWLIEYRSMLFGGVCAAVLTRCTIYLFVGRHTLLLYCCCCEAASGNLKLKSPQPVTPKNDNKHIKIITFLFIHLFIRYLW